MDSEAYLQLLDGEAAGNWLLVGHVLSSLEQHSRAAPSGDLWQDIVRKRLKKAGQSVSVGHLYKIRRAYQFIQEIEPDAVSRTPPPKISSVEVAERLYRLDPEAGKQALQDVLRPKPAAYVEIKKRYDQALEAKPETRSARHIAWERRKPNRIPTDPEEDDDFDAPISIEAEQDLSDLYEKLKKMDIADSRDLHRPVVNSIPMSDETTQVSIAPTPKENHSAGFYQEFQKPNLFPQRDDHILTHGELSYLMDKMNRINKQCQEIMRDLEDQRKILVRILKATQSR